MSSPRSEQPQRLQSVADTLKTFQNDEKQMSGYLESIQADLPTMVKEYLSTGTKYPNFENLLAIQDILIALPDISDFLKLMKENNIIDSGRSFLIFDRAKLPADKKKVFSDIFDIDARVKATNSLDCVKYIALYKTQAHNVKSQYLTQLETKYAALTKDFSSFQDLYSILSYHVYPKGQEKKYIEIVAHLLPALTTDTKQFSSIFDLLPSKEMQEKYYNDVVAAKKVSLDAIAYEKVLKILPEKKNEILTDDVIEKFSEGSTSVTNGMVLLADNNAKLEKFVKLTLLNGSLKILFHDVERGNKYVSKNIQDKMIKQLAAETSSTSNFTDNIEIVPFCMRSDYFKALESKLIELTKTPADAKIISRELAGSLDFVYKIGASEEVKRDYAQAVKEKFSVRSNESATSVLDEKQSNIEKKYLNPVREELLTYGFTKQDKFIMEAKKAVKEVSDKLGSYNLAVEDFAKKVRIFEKTVTDQKSGSGLPDYEYLSRMITSVNRIYKEAGRYVDNLTILNDLKRYKVQIETNTVCLMVMTTGTASLIPELKGAKDLYQEQVNLMNSPGMERIFEKFEVDTKLTPSMRLEALAEYFARPEVKVTLTKMAETKKIGLFGMNLNMKVRSDKKDAHIKAIEGKLNQFQAERGQAPTVS